MVEKADMADGLLLELEEERGRSGFFSFSYDLYLLVIDFVIIINFFFFFDPEHLIYCYKQELVGILSEKDR